jgi:hypothetical protein
MTNIAPKSDFQHVKVLTIDKLNSYIQYFDEIFDEAEQKRKGPDAGHAKKIKSEQKQLDKVNRRLKEVEGS